MIIHATFFEDGIPEAFYTDDVHGPFMLPIYGAPVVRPVFGTAPAPTEDDPDPAAPIIGEELDPTVSPNPPIVGEGANPGIPRNAIEITFDQWQEFRSNQGRRRWENGAVVPYEPPAPEPLPPQPLTARQLRLGLVTNGIMLDQVESTIVAIEDPQARSVAQIEWEYASQFERSHPLIAQVGAALGLSDEEIDAMWSGAQAL